MSNSAISEIAFASADCLCPHCLAEVEPSAARVPSRCGNCRLIIGAGRAVSRGQATVRTSGAAAGTLSARARREAIGMTIEPETALADLLRVADDLGVAPARLRMLDYQAAWEADQRLAALGQIISAFGSWKAARQAAARRSER